jgi:hypothetical protein
MLGSGRLNCAEAEVWLTRYRLSQLLRESRRGGAWCALNLVADPSP